MLSSPAAKVRREAPGPESARELTQLAAVVLTVIALSMLSYRFAHISLSSFIFDEPAKLEMARRLGATQVFDGRDPEVVAQVKAATDGGVDYAFEMAGSVAALECAYRLTRRGGTTVSAGLPNPAAQWPLQAVSLIAEERTIKGSYVGSCVPSRDIPRFVAMYRAGHLPVNELLSETITLDEINPALDRLSQGIAVRQVILPHGA